MKTLDFLAIVMLYALILDSDTGCYDKNDSIERG